MCNDEKFLRKQRNKKKNRIRNIIACIRKYQDLLEIKEYFTCFPDEIDKIIYGKWQFIPLHFVIQSNFIEAAFYLIEKGANVSLLDDYNMSALNRAVMIDSYELCEKLISIDKNLVNTESKEWRRTAIWHAVLQIGCRPPEAIDFRILDLLIENGADINKPISNGVTPYELITHQKNAKEIVSHLKNKFPQTKNHLGTVHDPLPQ
jgi:ankyrin repeat protein